MNIFRTFTLAHNGAPLLMRADAIDAFTPNGDSGNTRIFLRGDSEGFVVAESLDDVLRIIQS
jgi:hypothetical protein